MAMNKKTMFFSVYVFAILLLIALPINSKESALNNTYVFQLRTDYLGHAILFLPWMWLTPIAIGAQKNFKVTTPLWFVGGIAFAALTEGIQYLLPYRSFNFNDVIANSSGVLLGAALMLIFSRK
jgi:glycopeptide antibiotics resistance protein